MADSNRTAKLILSVEAVGADKAASQVKQVQASTNGLQAELAKIARADAITELAAKYGVVAKRTRDATTAAKELNEELKKINASENEIQGAAGTFSQASTAGLGPSGNALQRLGAQGRNLPSVQIPGAGIGTDAISNLTRLTGALGEAAGATTAMTTVTAALTPVLGATGAAVAGVVAVAGPVIAVAAILVLALKSIGDQAAAEAKAINTIVEGQRELAQRIAEGLTSNQAAEELEVLNKKRKDEADRLFKLQQSYDENVNSQTILQGVVKLTSGAEEELAAQIAKSKDLVQSYDGDITGLTKATEDGTLAANDAAEAEKKLADERSKTALSSADAAAKSLQAEQKALSATEEQNNSRLTAIENEKAVAQEQIDVLTASGVTSEEVTAKIKSLNDQLGLLGKESSFIKDTALAVSKQNDADKKAKKDAEDAAKKAEQAQEAYTKAVRGAATSFKQSTQDIGTRLTQALSDNTIKFNRDLTNINTKFNRDEFALDVKAKRAERAALIDQQQDLKDIKRDAAKDEAEALREGDFKLLFLAREKRDETLEQEQEGIDLARQKREQSNQDAREDLLLSTRYQRQDRLLGYTQQNADSRTSQQRELAQARLTQQRALQAASEAQSAGLGQIQNYWNKFLNIQQQGMNSSLKMAAGQNGAAGTRPPGPGGFTPGSSFVANAVGGIFKK